MAMDDSGINDSSIEGVNHAVTSSVPTAESARNNEAVVPVSERLRSTGAALRARHNAVIIWVTSQEEVYQAGPPEELPYMLREALVALRPEPLPTRPQDELAPGGAVDGSGARLSLAPGVDSANIFEDSAANLETTSTEGISPVDDTHMSHELTDIEAPVDASMPETATSEAPVDAVPDFMATTASPRASESMLHGGQPLIEEQYEEIAKLREELRRVHELLKQRENNEKLNQELSDCRAELLTSNLKCHRVTLDRNRLADEVARLEYEIKRRDVTDLGNDS